MAESKQQQGDALKKRTLAGIHLLSGVPHSRLLEVEQACTWHEYTPNQIVFDTQDTSSDVWFIVRGKLRIIIFSANPVTAKDEALAQGVPNATTTLVPVSDGGIAATNSVTLAEMVTGNAFGELSALDGQPRSARVMTLDNCLLASLPSTAFLQLVEECPKLATALLQRFAGLIRSLNRRVYSLSTLSPAQRIYTELVRLAEPNPNATGGWLIAALPGHGELADWAGAEREDVARAIGNLAREGIVERRNRSLVVRDTARLRALANL